MLFSDCPSDETLNRSPLALLLRRQYELPFGINIVQFSDKDYEGQGPSKPTKVPKGAHSSKDAYMLVYTERQAKQEPRHNAELDHLELEQSGLPQTVIDYINKDNAEFEFWIDEIIIDQVSAFFLI